MSRDREGRRAPTPEAPVSAAVSAVADLLTGESGTSRTFVGGLIVGALVGAAVAGAALVRSRPTGRAPAARPTRVR